MRVAVLGAGPAGVAAAHGRVRRGHDVVLVEARGGVGGHAAAITVAE
ncbi:MAG: NAD(P)-binding protein, partial [Acidimicrobiia bacterium]|nr:NAD(P)-binding protein [Acidimicrobiia bacterium]